MKDFFYIFFKMKYFPENYSLCRLWEKDRAEWNYYYGSIYDAYQRGRLRKEVQKKEYEILFDDKNVCYQLCKAANLPLPCQYACFEPNDNYRSMLVSIMVAHPLKNLIIKPVLGIGGKNIFIVYRKNNAVFVKGDGGETPIDQFILNSRSVVQECVLQHELLSEVSSSINTVRIVTMLTKKKEIIFVGALMRFGVKDAFIDNTSKGGVAIGIDLDTGTLKARGYDFNSKIYLSHPTSHVEFKGFQIPEWDSILDLTEKIQLAFPYYKLLGHDIALTEKGPVVIEINSAHDNIGIEQSYGPILENLTTRNTFKEYGLLINSAFS